MPPRRAPCARRRGAPGRDDPERGERVVRESERNGGDGDVYGEDDCEVCGNRGDLGSAARAFERGTRTGEEEEDDGEDGLPCPDGLCVLRSALQC